MRICQIAPYVSRDGSYGGPTTVAFAQCHALSGDHEVTLLAGSDGEVAPRTGLPYRQVYRRAFRPMASFGTLTSPSLWWWLLFHGRSFDVAHIHLARDFTVMPAALLCRLLRIPYVIQTHGMVKPAVGWIEKLYDRILTIPTVRSAGRAFFLTEIERDAVGAIPRHAPQEQIRNAVPLAKAGEVTSREPHEVLFCARLHRIKRPELFVEMAQTLTETDPGRFRFRMVGPDGGEMAAVRSRIKLLHHNTDLSYEGAVPPEAVADYLRRTDVLVLPSLREAFPMVVLEALAHGVPVIIDRKCGLASILDGRPGARVVDATAVTLALAVRDIVDNHAAESAAARGLAEQEFSIFRLGRQLESAYQEVCG